MTDSHEVHEFDNTVVAVLDLEPTTTEVVSRLEEAGYDYEVLTGTEGKKHLDPAGETSGSATVKRLFNAFGDQYRVLDKLNEHLDAGRSVVSVEIAEDAEAAEAIEILRNHGGDYVWKFGTWTFSRIGE